MERKIGEIFEYNGEWYQTVKASFDEHSCNGCQGCKGTGGPRIFGGECKGDARKDGKFVIFKKLEKVGGAYAHNSVIVQKYRIRATPVIMSNEPYMYFNAIDNTIAIEIKQNKEEDMKTVKVSKDDLNFLVNKIRYGILPKHTDCDEIIAEITDLFSMEDANLSNSENIGKNLKPFNLEAAKSGKPVCTRDGRKARILCYDFKQNEEYPILVTVENKDGKEFALLYSNDGISEMYKSSNNELAMLPEKKEGWVNVYKERIYSTKEEAIEATYDGVTYVDTVKVCWEE